MANDESAKLESGTSMRAKDIGRSEARNNRPRTDNGTVYIGKDHTAWDLVGRVLKSGRAEVILKARGSNISRAVDTEEQLRRQFPEWKLVSTEIGTENVTFPDRKDPKKMVDTKISFISIKVSK